MDNAAKALASILFVVSVISGLYAFIKPVYSWMDTIDERVTAVSRAMDARLKTHENEEGHRGLLESRATFRERFISLDAKITALKDKHATQKIRVDELISRLFNDRNKFLSEIADLQARIRFLEGERK